MTKSLSEKQKNAIRNYVKKGYSANIIQLKLQRRQMGIRRKTLLAEVRRFKGQAPKAQAVKYIPKKYAKSRWSVRVKRVRLRPLGEKQVTVIGRHYGKKIVKTQHGSGRELYRFILDEMTGDYWDEKPRVFS